MTTSPAPTQQSARQARPPGRGRRRRIPKGLIGVLLVIAGWELLRVAGVLDERAIPSVATMYRSVIDGLTEGELGPAIVSTLQAALTGLALAVLLAVPAGVLIGLSRVADRASGLLVELIRPVPSVAFVPIAIISLGLGFRTIVLVVTFASFWPMLFNVKAGVEDVDPVMLETGRVLGIRGLAAVWRIVLPSALPKMATGLRLGASTALVVTITAEIIIGRSGIGYYMESARIVGRVEEVWAAAVTAGILGYLLNVAVLAVERRKLSWAAAYQED